MAMSIGKFSVLGTLGRGANSSILHIRRNADSREYALKVVPIEDEEDRKFLEQARHEFRVAQMLGHPNIVKVYAMETVRNWLFQVRKAHMLIEYVPGKAMDETPPIPVPKLLPIMVQVASALQHMHRRGVFHGDLKPHNIILGRGNKPKVIDFGLAWIKGEPKERIQGTPEFMAPETVAAKVVTEQSDVFNFGATFYRLATFRNPPAAIVEGHAIKEKQWKAIFKPVEQANPNVPPEVAKLIHKCMAYKTEKRAVRMSDVKERLDGLAQQFPDPDAEFE